MVQSKRQLKHGCLKNESGALWGKRRGLQGSLGKGRGGPGAPGDRAGTPGGLWGPPGAPGGKGGSDEGQEGAEGKGPGVESKVKSHLSRCVISRVVR